MSTVDITPALKTKKVIAKKPKKEIIKTDQIQEVTRPLALEVCGYTVYLAEELRAFDKTFFYGCSILKSIIKNKNLSDTDSLFAYKKNEEWNISSNKYNRATFFITEEWAIANVPMMMEIIPINPYTYDKAPNIVFLQEEEIFKNIDGTIINIEVRGTNEFNKCFFKVKDVSEGFNMPSLYKTLIDTTNTITYEKDIHYKYFIIEKNRQEHTTNRNVSTSTKELFLTYKGMMRLLFCSQIGSTELFQDWATERLFTIQLGNKKAKNSLAANLLGVNSQVIKDVFECNTSETPCIYLITIGNANELLGETKYGKDDILYKYGKTSDLSRRIAEHTAFYRNMFKVDITLKQFSIVEAQFLTSAESDIRSSMEKHTISYKSQEELVVLDKIDLRNTETMYHHIQNSYIGTHKGLHDKMKKLELTILEKNSIIKDKDFEIEKLNTKIKSDSIEHGKDLEILATKHALDISNTELTFLQKQINFQSHT
jgi:hypothetical protein